MTDRAQPNWLLRGFIAVSVVVHVFVFLHVAGIYENNAVSYIELSMHQFSKPDVRHIPAPRPRPRQTKVKDVRQIKTKAFTLPRFKIETVRAQAMDHTYEKISMPDLPNDINVGDLAVAPNVVASVSPYQEQTVFTSAEEYFEMLQMRIHSAKQYPESAKSRQIEGRVKVEFTLQPDGTLSDVRVVKSSRHRNLDEAAVEAIKKASPFPRPPAFISKDPITLRINVSFELA